MVLPFFVKPFHRAFGILRGKMNDKFLERRA
jgi:hypothetical protein